MCYDYSNLGSVIINCNYDPKWSIYPITIRTPSLVTDTRDNMDLYVIFVYLPTLANSKPNDGFSLNLQNRVLTSIYKQGGQASFHDYSNAGAT
jgi:hypothetical protein